MRRILVFITLLALMVSVVPQSLTSLAASSAGDAPIRLKFATFTPAAGEVPSVPEQLAALEAAPDQVAEYLVQFQGPIQEAWKTDLAALGGTIMDYVPEFAFKVRMTPQVANQVSSLAEVVWIGPFHPAYKISPNVQRNEPGLYRVSLVEGASPLRVSAQIAANSDEILSHSGAVFTVAATPQQVNALARILDVDYIERFVPREKLNEYGGGAILGSNLANARGYDGSTQIVAVADTGIGGGTAATAHRDIPSSRVVAIYDWPAADNGNCWDAIPDGAQDVDSGHGTHTAGSVLSDGGPGGEGTGTAPAARLVFQAVEDFADMKGWCSFIYGGDGYYLLGLPDDLRNLYQQAYNAGARIHSDSWGSSVAGDYTEDAANTDDFIWSHRDFLMTTSAGNAGVDANSNGVVDEDSMGSPATAKNVLSVGASENDRQGNYQCDTSLSYTTCASQGGQNDIFTYGEAWGSNYPANPIRDDPAAGNAGQMAAFSSRGPTDDGRIKPDLVAPGTFVLSNYSDLYQQGYDSSPNPRNNVWQYDGWGFPLDRYYKYMGGTSMSNPLAAGAAAVVRDYYNKAHGHNASAALTKATLINSAVDMLDENNDGANDNDYPIPNNHEGWGRVDVDEATDGSHQYVDESAGVGTNGSRNYQYSIASSGNPFKVTLVWSDYRASTSASKALVNDLDLVVTAPGGATYRGNVFSGGWSQTGGSADRTNNVENVYVNSAASGTWTVEVRGYNVPNGPQPFALVVDGNFGGAPVDDPPTVTITAPADGSTVSGNVNVTATASDDNGVTQVEFFVDGNSIGVDTTAPYSTSWDSSSVNNGGHTISVTATDTIGQTGNDSISVTVNNTVPDDPPTVTITAPADGSTVSGNVNVTATASDDNGVTQVEFFVDGNSIGVDTTAPYSVSWDSTTVSNGAHTISATATDTIGLTGDDSIGVTVDNGPPPTGTMHVGDLDGSSQWTFGTWVWQATVTIKVVDSGGSPVSSATVDGNWSGGYSGSAQCTTDGNGQCQVASGNMSRRSSSATFEVDALSHASLSYQPGDNTDPDGDSNGTTITVNRP